MVGVMQIQKSLDMSSSTTHSQHSSTTDLQSIVDESSWSKPLEKKNVVNRHSFTLHKWGVWQTLWNTTVLDHSN